ncbi:hypothetical protein BN1321_260289 [Staphylococcus aureus]|uniref:Uncharacterized protein n=1 Tax=Staphylococcus aureus TaxID=1280 RepID=A0A0U1MME4_STAAU|nr:hypothetical protein BN1321_260289 [Staphylococcus aureus]
MSSSNYIFYYVYFPQSSALIMIYLRTDARSFKMAYNFVMI